MHGVDVPCQINLGGGCDSWVEVRVCMAESMAFKGVGEWLG